MTGIDWLIFAYFCWVTGFCLSLVIKPEWLSRAEAERVSAIREGRIDFEARVEDTIRKWDREDADHTEKGPVSRPAPPSTHL